MHFLLVFVLVLPWPAKKKESFISKPAFHCWSDNKNIKQSIWIKYPECVSMSCYVCVCEVSAWPSTVSGLKVRIFVLCFCLVFSVALLVIFCIMKIHPPSLSLVAHFEAFGLKLWCARVTYQSSADETNRSWLITLVGLTVEFGHFLGHFERFAVKCLCFSKRIPWIQFCLMTNDAYL